MVLFAEGASLVGGRYEICRAAGRGATGIVYQAIDHDDRRPVALKTLHVSSPAALFDLKQEFRSLAAVHHRNLVELYELVVDGHSAFFTMELIDGVPLLDDLGLAGDRVARIADRFLQLATGITALHHEGKLHRDIKPSNVMVERGGRIVILDLGFVLARDPDSVGDRSPAGADDGLSAARGEGAAPGAVPGGLPGAGRRASGDPALGRGDRAVPQRVPDPRRHRGRLAFAARRPDAASGPRRPHRDQRR